MFFLCDDDVIYATFFLTLTDDVVERLYSATNKDGSMYHPVQRKEKPEAQRERYVPAMNLGWWEPNLSSMAFVVYANASGDLQFKLADGYQRTASAHKANPPE